MDEKIMEPQEDYFKLREMIMGGWLAQSIYIIAELGIADQIQNGIQSIEVLSQKLNVHAPSLYRIMRVGVNYGLFSETQDGHFELTNLSQYLLSDAPISLKSMASYFGRPWHREVWSHLMYTIQTGEPAFPQVHKEEFFDYLVQHPEEERLFQNTMINYSQYHIPCILKNYDFSKFNSVADIGAGYGWLLAGILEKYPKLKGIYFDLPSNLDNAKKFLNDKGLISRCKMVTGDFFTSVPSNADMYLLKLVLHDWSDIQCQTILKNIRKAIPNNGRLLIIDMAIPSNNIQPGILLDIEILAILPGKERTEKEVEEMLTMSQFKLNKIINTGYDFSIIEAIPC